MTDTKRGAAQLRADSGRPAGLAPVNLEPGRASPGDTTVREEL